VCPQYPPQSGTACFGQGDCFYSEGGSCDEEDCECGPSGIWFCSYSICADAGPPDSGFFDSGDICPGGQPPDGASCGDEGNVCTYFSPCETNCLCTGSGWVCATVQGCSGTDF
jgi:hypothetical protein